MAMEQSLVPISLNGRLNREDLVAVAGKEPTKPPKPTTAVRPEMSLVPLL